jgi:hypothetical protein
MSSRKPFSPVQANESSQPSVHGELNKQPNRVIRRRSFLKGLGVTGAAITAGVLLGETSEAASGPPITQGDAAILRFLAAAEIIESDLWLQYQELLGVQGNEVSSVASKQIPGYPAAPTGGNAAFTTEILKLDGDMPQYIHDNTDDELSHETFINAYLISQGFDPVSLDAFRTFQNLATPAVGPNLQANLIMPEPTVFLAPQFPPVSIIRPTATANAAMGAVKALTADGLFIGQTSDFFNFVTELATMADAAQRGSV